MSNGRCDLHCHTTASDGTFSPRELVATAHDAGLSGIGMTDHDSVDGLSEAMDEGRRLGLRVVPGVEISTDIGDDEQHILGYYIDYEDEQFLHLLREQRDNRRDRARRMVQRLSELGVKLSLERVLEIAGEGSVGRPHIARALVEAGHAVSWEDAFARFIGRRAPAYVRRSKLQPVDAVKAILKAKGVPVLAHPGLSRKDSSIEGLVNEGLMGIEAVYPDHLPEVEERYRCIASRHGLIVTGGSDCHGPGSKSGVQLGKATVDQSVMDELLAAHRWVEESAGGW